MPNRTRVPRKDAEFDSYIKTSTLYLLSGTNATRLGVTGAEVTAWGSFNNQWTAIYNQYSDLNQRTKAVTATKNDIKNDATEFMQKILTRLAGNPDLLTESDRAALNIKERDTNPSPRPTITTQPYAEMQATGGGRIKITLRVQNDNSRASMQPDADSIEMAYSIGSSPASPEAAQTHIVYRKALHTLDAGMGNLGSKLYAFFRWNNSSDSAKSGPWSNIVQVVIA